MASEDLQTVLFNSGRLIINPTDLVTAPNFGGTVLGLVRDIFVMPTQITHEVKAEEFGNVAVEVIDGGRAWVLGCNLRGWDNDAISTVFPGTVTGSSSGQTGIRDTTTNPRAGNNLSSNSVVLLFVPDDTDRHQAVLLYRAIPMIDEVAELALQLASEFLTPVMFKAIPDSSGNIFAAQLMEDLSLT